MLIFKLMRTCQYCGSSNVIGGLCEDCGFNTDKYVRLAFGGYDPIRTRGPATPFGERT